MPKTFAKVHKHISKKRGAVDALHEFSRDARRLRRANHRDDRVAKASVTTSRGRQSYSKLISCLCHCMMACCFEKQIIDPFAVDRIAYFQETIPDDAQPFSDEDIMQTITKYALRQSFQIFVCRTLANACASDSYINRSNPEIEQLKSERRKGRPPSKREEVLLQRMDAESKEYKTGFWMPDFSQPEVLRALAIWNGDWSGLSMMKFIRFTKESGKQASSFPPKGLS